LAVIRARRSNGGEIPERRGWSAEKAFLATILLRNCSTSIAYYMEHRSEKLRDIRINLLQTILGPGRPSNGTNTTGSKVPLSLPKEIMITPDPGAPVPSDEDVAALPHEDVEEATNHDDLHQKFDEILRRLVEDLGEEISFEEQLEILHFVDVHEFGLALSTTTGIIVEDDKRVPASLIMAIRSLAEQTGITDELPNDLDKYAQKPWPP
jgi:hypothetical protein